MCTIPLSLSTPIDQLIQNDLFRTGLNAVHTPDPLHLIGSLQCFGHTFLRCHLPREQFHSSVTGTVDLNQMGIELLRQKKEGRFQSKVLGSVLFFWYNSYITKNSTGREKSNVYNS